MGTDPDQLRALLQAAAEHGDVTSRGFVSALARTLAQGAAFDAAGLVLEGDDGVLRARLLARQEQSPLALAWDARLATIDPSAGQDCRAPVRVDTTSSAGPVGAALASVGLHAAAWAPLGPRPSSTRLCVAAVDAASLAIDLQKLGDLAQAVGTLWGLLTPTAASTELAGLEQLDYFAAIGRLAGGLVHEVNNPATFIALAAGQLEKALARYEHAADLETQIALAREIGESVRQMRSVVSDFHVVSTVARHAVSGSLDLTRMLRASASLTAVAYRTQAALDVHIDDLPSCPSSFMSLVPVLVHLIINAIQSIPTGKAAASSIRVRASGDERHLLLSVHDSGCGMDQTTLERACEPFFTTRPEGAGVGLTLAREAVRRLGGRLELQSEPGVGTTAQVDVPIPPA